MISSASSAGDRLELALAALAHALERHREAVGAGRSSGGWIGRAGRRAADGRRRCRRRCCQFPPRRPHRRQHGSAERSGTRSSPRSGPSKFSHRPTRHRRSRRARRLRSRRPAARSRTETWCLRRRPPGRPARIPSRTCGETVRSSRSSSWSLPFPLANLFSSGPRPSSRAAPATAPEGAAAPVAASSSPPPTGRIIGPQRRKRVTYSV